MAQPRAIESVEEPDHAAMQLTMVRGGIVWGIVSAALVLLVYRQFLWAAIVGAIGLALFAWVRQSGKARRGTVRLDADGIHKLAPLPWSVAWGDIESAELSDHEKSVLLTVAPKTPVRHWSRTFRRGIDLPKGVYMATVFPELRNDIERYIAGRLGREPKLVDMPEPDPEVIAREAQRAAKARGPLRVLSRDPVNMRASFYWVGIVAAGVAVLAWGMATNQIWVIVIAGLVTLGLAFPLSQALSTRKSDIKIDDEGIQRNGGWGWWFEWEELSSAEIVERDELYYLVLTPADPNAKPHRSRRRLPAEDAAVAPTAVIAPVDVRGVEAIEKHLQGRTYGA